MYIGFACLSGKVTELEFLSFIGKASGRVGK